jgi:uncharacterized protein YecT (DUF1311 family)
MEAKVEYWDRDYKSYKSELVRTETLSGTKEEIFAKYYEKNNQLRYCNGSYYSFEDKELDTEYKKWYNQLSESVKFHMYYGNGTVD